MIMRERSDEHVMMSPGKITQRMMEQAQARSTEHVGADTEHSNRKSEYLKKT